MDEVMQEAYDILSYLPWSGCIWGFDSSEPLHTLATYATCNWLSTTHEDQMLDLLQCDVLFKGLKIKIKNMAFFMKLCNAYNHWDSGEYSESCCFAHI
jgi:hypothetical protein